MEERGEGRGEEQEEEVTEEKVVKEEEDQLPGGDGEMKEEKRVSSPVSPPDEEEQKETAKECHKGTEENVGKSSTGVALCGLVPSGDGDVPAATLSSSAEPSAPPATPAAQAGKTSAPPLQKGLSSCCRSRFLLLPPFLPRCSSLVYASSLLCVICQEVSGGFIGLKEHFTSFPLS